MPGKGWNGLGLVRSGAVSRSAALATLAVVLLAALSSASVSCIQSTSQTWTVMIYMAADASPELPWELDIGEMEAVDLPGEVRVIVLVDPPDGPNSMLLRIVNDPNGLDFNIVSEVLDDEGAVIPQSGEVNTGSPAALSDFIVYCAEQYVSDRYVLVLWGHGAQWHGICPDGTDLLTLPELADALDDAKDTIGRKLDLIAVDACAEANIEMLLEVGPYADLFVASEMNVPSEGLPYVTVLGGLAMDTGQSPLEFGELVVDSYMQWASFADYEAVDMAVFDLSRCGDLADRLDMVASVCSGYSQLYRDELLEACLGSELYGEDWVLDFGDMLVRLASGDLPLELAAAATDAALEYREMLVHSGTYRQPDQEDRTTDGNYTGTSIYAPSPGMPDLGYSQLSIATTGWYALSMLLRGEALPFEQVPGPVAVYLDSDSDDDDLPDSLILTWPGGMPASSVVTAYIFSDGRGSIRDLGTVSSGGAELMIAGIYGELLISARATVDGFVVSHSRISATLHGLAYLELSLFGDGLRQDAAFDALVISANSTMRAPLESGSATFAIPVPGFAANGEVVEVQVLDRATDRVRTNVLTGLDGVRTNLSLYVPELVDDRPWVDAYALALLVLTVLPAASAAAIYGYSRVRKKV